MKNILGLLSMSLTLGLNTAIAQTKITEPGSSNSTAIKPDVQEPQAIQPEVFVYVEQMPEFNGGQTALVNYLSSNIKYPKAEQEAGHEGKAMAKFIVNEDGSISDVTIVRSSGSNALDGEAKRIVSSMPNWKPGKQNGKAVKTYFNLPIVFRLETNEKENQK
jgi:periplasmic protein TonB